MQVESNLAKIIIIKKSKAKEVGMFLPGCETPGAALEHGELQGVRAAFWRLCVHQLIGSSLALGSDWGPEPNPQGPRPVPPESAAQVAAHSPPLLPHRAGRGLTSRFGNQRSLVPSLVLGAFPCRSWSSRWQTGPTT